VSLVTPSPFAPKARASQTRAAWAVQDENAMAARRNNAMRARWVRDVRMQFENLGMGPF